MQMNMTEPELALALMEQRPGAARVAMKRFSPLVHSVLKRGLGASPELEDVQQEVFMCVFRRISTLRDPVALKGFVMGIAFNIIFLERRRRKQRSRVSLEQPMVFDLQQGRSTTGMHAAWMRLESLLARLRERDRAAFVLRFIERRSTNEVATMLGLSVATARRSFSYAWKRVTAWAERDPFLAEYFDRKLKLRLN
ncbi:MAG: polymerase sigma factor [Polyangiaceae bacterium]|jgi:RNA polymerase sigma-70 factor (ECF subfamily)|nr:polymerase sigma factor [Polyangiaceae bacterium]